MLGRDGPEMRPAMAILMLVRSNPITRLANGRPTRLLPIFSPHNNLEREKEKQAIRRYDEHHASPTFASTGLASSSSLRWPLLARKSAAKHVGDADCSAASQEGDQ